jgi:hypothetical protein
MVFEFSALRQGFAERDVKMNLWSHGHLTSFVSLVSKCRHLVEDCFRRVRRKG